MKHSERFALNQWLTNYPENKSYAEIIDLILAESDKVLSWVFAGFDTEDVISKIEDTRLNLESMMDNLLYGVDLAQKTEEESILEGAMKE